MDVTCGILFSTDSSTMAQLECALLASNYDEIEKYAKKLKKKHEISPGKTEIIVKLICYNAIYILLYTYIMHYNINSIRIRNYFGLLCQYSQTSKITRSQFGIGFDSFTCLSSEK